MNILNNEQYKVHFQSTRELFIRIFLLNSNNIKVDEMHGVVLDGSINITANSPVRRTCSLSLIVKDSSFLIGEDKKIWIDKRIRIDIGIKNILTDEIEWFNKGVYCLNQPSLRYDSISKTLSLQCLDLMCLLDGTLDGNLEAPITRINVDTDISEAIKDTAEGLGDVDSNNLNIEEINKNTPYTIEKNAGETVYSMLKELAGLYKDWELYFNEKGILTFTKIKNKINDPIIINFEELNKDLIQDYLIDNSFENVKNKVIVYGKQLNDGSKIKSIKTNTDPNNPFNVDKLGEKSITLTDQNVFNQEQGDILAEYYLKQYSNFNETVSITCLPIYFLDVNKLVYFNKPEINLTGKYLITDINIPLSITGLMTFKGYKIYD